MAIKYFIPAFIWASLIFIAISLPGSYIPKTGLNKIQHFDKLVHFGLFLVLGFLLSYGFFSQPQLKMQIWYYAAISLFIGIFYGAITEIMQFLFFTLRHGNFYDFLANSFGTIFGILLFVIFGKPLIRKKLRTAEK